MSEFWCLTGSSLSTANFLSCYLEPASDAVVEYIGETPGVQTITREKRRSKFTLDQDLWIDFWIKPVSSVSRIALAWGADTDNETELDLDCLDLFQVEGYALLPFASVQACAARVNRSDAGVGWLTLGSEYITVSNYIGGEILHNNIRKAIALIAQEDYLVRAGILTSGITAGPVKSYSIGQYSQTLGSAYSGYAKLAGTLGWGTPLSEMAEKLLLPFVGAGSVGPLGN